ncbi:MAG: hypothetical protein ACRENY_09200 [Candidatus Dormibacteria bacterium]
MGALLCCLPPLALLALIRVDGVNVPNTDDWYLISLLQRLDHGHLSLAALWAQHFEGRLIVSDSVMLGLAVVTRVDLKLAMYAGWVLLTLACLGLALLLRRHSRLGWWWLLPISLLLFSLQQYGVVLAAFLLSAYLVLPCLVAMIWALLRARRSRGFYLLAVALSLIATYSISQGLAFWPAGLALLVVSGQSVRRALIWVGCAIVAVAIYAQGYTFQGSGGNLGWIASHPGGALTFFLEFLGGLVPRSSRIGWAGTEQAALGLLVLLAGLAVVALAVWHRERLEELWVPATLICFGLAVGLLTTSGRAQFGVGYALEPRYDLFALWVLAGVWAALAVLWRRSGATWAGGALVLAGLVCAFQVVLSFHAGLDSGRQLRHDREVAVGVVRDYRTASPEEVQRYVFGHVDEFRQRAGFLEQHRLSVFRR